MAANDTRARQPARGDSASDASAFRLRLELLQVLVMRELRTRYRGSYLGWLWALARPLVMLLIYGLIIGVFLGAARSIPEFMIFIFVGLIAWNLFFSLVTGSINSIISNGPLLAKASFPRALLPIASAVVALVDAAIQAGVLLIGYVIVGHWPSASSLLYLIPALIGVCLFGLALGLLLSAVNVYIRDAGFLTEIALQVGFWLCPILYSYKFVVDAAASYGLSTEWVTRVYLLNPMANGVLGFQRALWPPASEGNASTLLFPGELWIRLWIFVGIGAVLLWLCAVLFNRLSRNFAQEL